MHPADPGSSNQNAQKMGSTSQYSVRGAYVGVLISMEMNCTELGHMDLHSLLAQTDRHPVCRFLI